MSRQRPEVRRPGPSSPRSDDLARAEQKTYVATIVAVAERDDSIARVLREICALDGAVRGGALDLVGGYLRSAGRDVMDVSRRCAATRSRVASPSGSGPPG